jgi:phosphatidylglycerophosphatase C
MAPNPGVSAAGVAAFDFDGTLVRGDSLPGFLSLVLGRARFARVLLGAGPAMTAAYRRTGRDGAKAVLLRRALAGFDAAALAAAGEEFGALLATKVRPDMAERLVWHEQAGHVRILVSASLAVYLEPFGRLAGFHHVIATALEVGPDARLTGHLEGPNVRAQQKATRLLAMLPPDAELWAYGNSAGDREMLALAHHPALVRRGRRLPALSARLSG